MLRMVMSGAFLPKQGSILGGNASYTSYHKGLSAGFRAPERRRPRTLQDKLVVYFTDNENE